MVKNTGAQAAASLGYASDQVMISTVNSGVIATEGLLFGDTLKGTAALTAYERGKEDGTNVKPFIFGESEKSRRSLAAGQFFSSKLQYFNKLNGEARFEVASAKSAGGKSMKRAQAFYVLKNTKQEVSTTAQTAKNAFYSKARLRDINSGLKVKGNATFEGKVWVNLNGVPFVVDSGTAYFHDSVHMGGSVTAESGFNRNVYFNNHTTLQMNAVLFKNDPAVIDPITGLPKINKVGFNSHFSTQSGDIGAQGNVYMGGDFIRGAEGGGGGLIGTFDGNTKISKDGTALSDFYYTEKLSWTGSAYCTLGPDGKCTKTHTTHMAPNTNGKVPESAPFAHVAAANIGFSTKTPVDNMNVLNSVGMDPIAERRDPQLSMANVYAANTANGGNIIKPVCGMVTGKQLDDMWGEADSKGELYQGNLVVKIGIMEQCKDQKVGDIITATTSNDKFSKQVIFIVGDKSNLSSNGTYYNCDPNSRTLIYVEGSGYLNNFGTANSFYGLVYIAEDNVPNVNNRPYDDSKWATDPYYSTYERNSFVGNIGEIQGAIHNFSIVPAQWVSGNQGTMSIKFNPTVLSHYGFLQEGATTTTPGGTVITIDNKNDPHIYPVLGGFYFY